MLLYRWAREYPVSDASEEAEIHIGTGVDIYQWLRDVCSARLLSSPIILGGPNTMVQIDESLFRHKPKVIISVLVLCSYAFSISALVLCSYAFSISALVLCSYAFSQFLQLESQRLTNTN